MSTLTASAPMGNSQNRSRLLAFLLTLFFGPLGMLYTTVVGALVMLVLFGVLGFLTGGLALIILWPIAIIWAVLAAK